MTSLTLKLIAAACMLVDHIGATAPGADPGFFRVAGRVAFPLFAFIIAEGCSRTRDIRRYLGRLLLFAFVSEGPFDMAFSDERGSPAALFGAVDFLRGTNVFYTLFLAALAIACYRALASFAGRSNAGRTSPEALTNAGRTNAGARTNAGRTNARALALAARALGLAAVLPAMYAAELLSSDYAAPGVAIIFAIYVAGPRNRVAACSVLAAGALWLYAWPAAVSVQYALARGARLSALAGWILREPLPMLAAALASVPLVALYNGRLGGPGSGSACFVGQGGPGSGKPAVLASGSGQSPVPDSLNGLGPGGPAGGLPRAVVKWSFYLFYPAHLLALAAIASILGV